MTNSNGKNKALQALSLAGIILAAGIAPAQAFAQVPVTVSNQTVVTQQAPTLNEFSTNTVSNSATSSVALPNTSTSQVAEATVPSYEVRVNRTLGSTSGNAPTANSGTTTTTTNPNAAIPNISAPGTGTVITPQTSPTTIKDTSSTVTPADLSRLTGTDASKLSDQQVKVLTAAYSGLGGNYVWGGKTFKNWDCSGYVSWVYKQAGINLTAYTYAMKNEVTRTNNPQPGDIVFTNNYAHVGIYLGGGKMISALNPSQGTLVTAVDGGGYMPVDGYYTVNR